MRRISNFEIDGLFDVFCHKIRLNLEDRITIIHGPNGIGKTVLLSLLESVVKSNFNRLRSIPFKRMLMEFDDGGSLAIEKSLIQPSLIPAEKDELEPVEMHFIATIEKETMKWKTTASPSELSELRLQLIEQTVPHLERIARRRWLNSRTGEYMTLEEVLDEYADRLPDRYLYKASPPSWLKEIQESLSVRFIETKRLDRRAQSNEGHPRHVAKMHSSHAVLNFAEDLSREIQTILRRYADISQKLDSTFPSRLVGTETIAAFDEVVLRTRLQEIEEKREALIKIGLLGKESEGVAGLIVPTKTSQANWHVLSLFAEDMEKKLSVFDELKQKMDILNGVITRRFNYKVIAFSAEKGFYFTSDRGQSLSAEKLSSGEQHELVLFYEMLFNVEEDTLVLIDEPELSLHVSWQREFLSDVKEITDLRHFDLLIASHSPDIISDRWDLTVRLEGSPVGE